MVHMVYFFEIVLEIYRKLLVLVVYKVAGTVFQRLPRTGGKSQVGFLHRDRVQVPIWAQNKFLLGYILDGTDSSVIINKLRTI